MTRTDRHCYFLSSWQSQKIDLMKKWKLSINGSCLKNDFSSSDGWSGKRGGKSQNWWQCHTEMQESGFSAIWKLLDSDQPWTNIIRWRNWVVNVKLKLWNWVWTGNLLSGGRLKVEIWLADQQSQTQLNIIGVTREDLRWVSQYYQYHHIMF